MKKFIFLLSLLLAFTGCSLPGGITTVANPANFFSTGVYPLLIVAELETNLSSVVIDKTKAKVENVSVTPIDILPEGSAIFVMPTRMMQAKKSSWDTYYSKMTENFIKMNNYAKISSEPESADYVLSISVSESPEVWHGANYSAVTMTIMEKDETPVFNTKVNVTSKSDKNFYYNLSKSARPVKDLTLLAFETIYREALPKAFNGEANKNDD